MGVLAKYLDDHEPVRNPAYRPLAVIDDEERARLGEKIGGPENYGADVLQRMIIADPEDVEYKRAMVSSIVSAEYAGIDAFGRNVARWEDQEVPDGLIHAMVRQTWDEVRHARLGTELLELEYGGTLGEYPDTLAGASASQQMDQEQRQAMRIRQLNPVMSLSSTNVGVEGAALRLFSGVSRLGQHIGDEMMELVYDYNWADEVVHVAIGDWFLKKIAEQKPESERVAMRAQAMTEAMRERVTRNVSDEVKAEVIDFMQGETDRATSVLVGPLSDGYEPDAEPASKDSSAAGY